MEVNLLKFFLKLESPDIFNGNPLMELLSFSTNKVDSSLREA